MPTLCKIYRIVPFLKISALIAFIEPYWLCQIIYLIGIFQSPKKYEIFVSKKKKIISSNIKNLLTPISHTCRHQKVISTHSLLYFLCENDTKAAHTYTHKKRERAFKNHKKHIFWCHKNEQFMLSVLCIMWYGSEDESLNYFTWMYTMCGWRMENFHPQNRIQKRPACTCVHVRKEYELHNIIWKKGFMDIAQKEHCRHNQHDDDDDDNGIKIKFPPFFSILIEQQ